MKQARHHKICELIETHDIETQEELVSHLQKCGFDVTQATISRDIKALKLVKTLSNDGLTYKYAIADNINNDLSAYKIFLSKMIISITAAGNLLVIKTIRGAAMAVSETLRSMRWLDILGDIAGYDTVFVAVSTPESLNDLKEKLEAFMRISEEE